MNAQDKHQPTNSRLSNGSWSRSRSKLQTSASVGDSLKSLASGTDFTSANDNDARASSGRGKNYVRRNGKRIPGVTQSTNQRSNTATNTNTTTRHPPSSRRSKHLAEKHQVVNELETLNESVICMTNEVKNGEMASSRKDSDPRQLLLEQETDLDGNEENEATSLLGSSTKEPIKEQNNFVKTDLRRSKTLDLRPLPDGWEQHSDKQGLYYWHIKSGIVQRNRPTAELSPRKESIVLYHDDEEINQDMSQPKTSSSDDEFYESGAALTVDDANEMTFLVNPIGCCEFDETQLTSLTNTKAIQKCILRLANQPPSPATSVWGLDPAHPILMKLVEDYIQFIDFKTQALLRSQPIHTIKTWAVDDDNNFAFVVEDQATQAHSAPHSPEADTVENRLLSEPVLICYVFNSIDDDDMSIKIANKLNEEINRYREQMTDRIVRSTRVQQMIEIQPNKDDDSTEVEDDEFDDELEASHELTMNVRYIGKTPVPRPSGIDVLNIAIDKCLADASNLEATRQRSASADEKNSTNSGTETIRDYTENSSPFVEAKLHVSPSSVIVENVITGEIIAECRIRFLTFIGISRRDIRWCGFIMQNATNKTFVAHCFECHPTAGPVCDAMQQSCMKMYEKVVKTARHQPETMSIIPTRARIRNTLAKTFSRIRLNPIS